MVSLSRPMAAPAQRQELRLRRPRRDDAQGLRGRGAAVQVAWAGVCISTPCTRWRSD